MEKLKHKVRSDVFESLIDANIRSLSSILLCNKTELCQTTKLDLNTIDEVIKETSLIILSGKVYTANCVLNQQYISTGCPALNAIMRGGIPLNGITEIVGSSGVGKTQMCLQLSLMTQLPLSLGGLGKSVIYICTEDIFPVKRLSELAQIFSLKYKNHVKIDFEDNIFLEHIADIAQLKKCLFNTLPHLFTVKNVGLIVIDSIAGVFRSENLDIKYPSRSQDFISITSKLNKLSKKYNFATICINQVTDNPVTDTTEPCLGLAWSNVVTRRFNINRFFRSQVRTFQVVFAPDLPNKERKFKITREGLIGTE